MNKCGFLLLFCFFRWIVSERDKQRRPRTPLPIKSEELHWKSTSPLHSRSDEFSSVEWLVTIDTEWRHRLHVDRDAFIVGPFVDFHSWSWFVCHWSSISVREWTFAQGLTNVWTCLSLETRWELSVDRRALYLTIDLLVWQTWIHQRRFSLRNTTNSHCYRLRR